MLKVVERTSQEGKGSVAADPTEGRKRGQAELGLAPTPTVLYKPFNHKLFHLHYALCFGVGLLMVFHHFIVHHYYFTLSYINVKNIRLRSGVVKNK